MVMVAGGKHEAAGRLAVRHTSLSHRGRAMLRISFSFLMVQHRTSSGCHACTVYTDGRAVYCGGYLLADYEPEH